jgi:hypothetical protein
MSRRVKCPIDHAFAVPHAAPCRELDENEGVRKRFLLRRRMEWWMS